ncbi:hypothetical protein Pan110_06170 [Gimesia panareensis]|nr:hypothetical protein Pan110_06170 [Gimesia panareensis]
MVNTYIAKAVDLIITPGATVGLPDSADQIGDSHFDGWVSPNAIRAERSEQEVAAHQNNS